MTGFVAGIFAPMGTGSISAILKPLTRWKDEHELWVSVDDDLTREFKQAKLAECARKLSVANEIVAGPEKAKTAANGMHLDDEKN